MTRRCSKLIILLTASILWCPMPASAQSAEESARAFMAPVTEWPGPTTGPAAVPGKRVVAVSCGMSSEGCARPVDGMVEAGEALGWEVEACDGDFDPGKFIACVDLAINTRADGLLLQAISDEFIADPLARARAQGIVVASTEGLNTPSDTGVSFEIDAGWDRQGEALASYLAWKNAGDSTTLMQYERSYRAVVKLNQRATEVLASNGGEVIEFDFSEMELFTDFPGRTVAAVRANPEINGIVIFDDGVIAMIPEMKAAGLLAGRLLAGYNLITPSINAVRAGDQAASAGAEQVWEGWAAADNLNRIFAGQSPVAQNVPVVMITAENVDRVPEGTADVVDVDFRAHYRSIWVP